MIIAYSSQFTGKNYLLIKAGIPSYKTFENDESYSHIQSLLSETSEFHYKPYKNDFRITKHYNRNYFEIQRLDWRETKLTNRMMCFLLWEKYDFKKYSENENIASKIVEIPFISSFLKKISTPNWDSLFFIIELLAENIKEEFSKPPETILGSIQDGYTFQCSHIAAFTAACFYKLGIPTRICFGFASNEVYISHGLPFFYFYESNHSGFSGILHCWLEVLFEGAIYLLDPTPYFCSYQQWLYGKIDLPRKKYTDTLKKVACQNYFAQGLLFEVMGST